MLRLRCPNGISIEPCNRSTICLDMIAQGNPSDYAFAQSLGRRRARHWAWALPIHGGRYGLYVAEGQGTGHTYIRRYIRVIWGLFGVEGRDSNNGESTGKNEHEAELGLYRGLWGSPLPWKVRGGVVSRIIMGIPGVSIWLKFSRRVHEYEG